MLLRNLLQVVVAIMKIVKLRQWSGKDWQGMALKAKGLKAQNPPRAYIKVGCHLCIEKYREIKIINTSR